MRERFHRAPHSVPHRATTAASDLQITAATGRVHAPHETATAATRRALLFIVASVPSIVRDVRPLSHAVVGMLHIRVVAYVFLFSQVVNACDHATDT